VPRTDPEALAAAASAAVGRHDFRSLATAATPVRSTVRTLWAVRWTFEEPLAHLEVVGDGFLHKMVRTLVGTLCRAARDPDPAASVRAALLARDRSASGPTAPPHALVLMAVAFPGEPAPTRVPLALREAVESPSHRAAGGTP
jgi:tRNA pseudouridine38-40 synthase